jgi:endonuclease/exonuclease/phosphatase family metal-dependent hydrolase
MTSLGTFNVNNFFLRYRFANTYPGDTSRSSLIEAGEVGLVGYLPGRAFGNYTSRFIVWDAQRRDLAARALSEPDGQLPDILCFQEVENIHAIRIFNERYLAGYYPYSLLIDAYDPRRIDVGLLSRFPVNEVRSHIDELDDQGNRIFSRDCLEATVELPGGELLTLFINHLKSKFVRRQANETDAHYNDRVLASHQKRLAQAQGVADYVDARFLGQHTQALYAVIGDFNDTPESPWVAPLINSPHLTDILAAHRPRTDRWTYYWRSRGRVSQIDYILASSALATRINNLVAADPTRRPHIERQGLAYRELNNANQVLPREAWLVHFESDAVTPAPANASPNEKVDFRFPRYPDVFPHWRSNISDHCPVKVWF